jgi:hypothetical protein
MPDPFISPQDIVDYLGRGGTADPGMLIATDAACDIVRTLAERDFNAGTATITLDGTGTDALLIPNRYLPATVGTVTERDHGLRRQQQRDDLPGLRRGESASGVADGPPERAGDDHARLPRDRSTEGRADGRPVDRVEAGGSGCSDGGVRRGGPGEVRGRGD